MKHDTKSIFKTFKSFYSNLAGNLLAKLPKASNRYTIKFVSDYYKKLLLPENFKLDATTEGYCLNYRKISRSQKQQKLTKFQENF